MKFAPTIIFVVVQALASTVETTVYNEVQCGMAAPQNGTKEYLYGGSPVTGHDYPYPWMVSIQIGDGLPLSHSCGGIVINSTWILTAAHCRHPMSRSPNVKLVIGGTKSLTSNSSYKVEIPKEDFKLFPHKDHRTPDQFSNNIMLIQLKTPLNYNTGVRPICLPKPRPTRLSSLKCLVAGWGVASNSQCKPLWRAEVNKFLSPNELNTEAADIKQCMEECYGNIKCHAINFDFNGGRCFSVTNKKAKRRTQYLSTVLHLNRNCTDCAKCENIWTEYNGYKSNDYVMQDRGANSITECKLNCTLHPNCTGIDFTDKNAYGTPRCFMSMTEADDLRLLPARGFKHLELTRDFGNEERYGSDLREAVMPAVSYDDCVDMYNGTKGAFRLLNKTTNLCAGDPTGRRDTCLGDSGSPLMCRRNDAAPWVLYGIVSGGPSECGQRDKVTIFAKVSGYLDWITSVMDNPSGAEDDLEDACITAVQGDTYCIRENSDICHLLPIAYYQACENCTVYYECDAEGDQVMHRCPARRKWDQSLGRCETRSKTCSNCPKTT